MSLKDDKCPHCGTTGSLYICSFAAVNCSECREFIRKANKEEMQIAFKRFKALQKFIVSEKA